MHFKKKPFPVDKIIQERIKMFVKPMFKSKMVDETMNSN